MYGQQQYPNYPQASGYDASGMHFEQYRYDTAQAPGMMHTNESAGYMGTMFTPSSVPAANPTPNSFDDEPPLLEELGINFDHILQKTLVVLNPVKNADVEVVQDTDLAGPLVFCLVFGGTLLLAGKLQFGYIYGIGLVGCLAMYALLNCMSNYGVSVACIMSTLGYCLLPMCLLSSMAIVLSLKGSMGVVLTALIVLWCSISASKLFVTGLSMDHQQVLVAYPCALVYGVFALLTVF